MQGISPEKTKKKKKKKMQQDYRGKNPKKEESMKGEGEKTLDMGIIKEMMHRTALCLKKTFDFGRICSKVE